MAPRVLLVEDDASGRALAQFNLQRAGYEVDAVDAGETALELFSAARHDLVITDIRMGQVSGLDVLRAVAVQSPATPVIVMTAFAEVDVAVEAMKSGAADFVGKPFSRDHLLFVVERTLARRDAEAELGRRRREDPHRMIAESEPMRAAVKLLDHAAKSGRPAWIHGGSGTGKSLAAARIHAARPHRAGAFVSFNASVVPKVRHHADLFGPRGRFELAAGGTLVLEHVDQLAEDAQVALAHHLEVTDGDVTIVATSTKAPGVSVAEGLAEALVFRLAGVEVYLPPLCERTDDLEPLLEAALGRLAPGQVFSKEPGLLEALRARSWPGNLREFESVCERLVALGDAGILRVADLPADARDREGGSQDDPLAGWPDLPADGISLVDLERRVIERVLALKHDNITHAAQYLGVPRHVLAYRMEKYGLKKRRG